MLFLLFETRSLSLVQAGQERCTPFLLPPRVLELQDLAASDVLNEEKE